MPLNTRLGRYALIGFFDLISSKKTLAVCTSHLESYAEDVVYRKDQAAAIVQKLLKYNCDCHIFMGDTNMKTENEDTILLNNKFIDTGIEAGYTCNREINSWSKNINRIDRIYLRSNSFIKTESLVIGNTPVEIAPKTFIFPSDHFGLLTKCKIT